MSYSLPTDVSAAPWVVALGDLVRERLGYEVPEHRMTLEIAPRLLAYAESHGHRDPESLITSIGSAPAGSDWQALVQMVTVGETYFLRHPSQLTALAAHLEEQSGSLGRPLKIWSAGCATGEEAYSLAMLLVDADVPFQLVGTDIDKAALGKARAGSGFSDRSVAHLPVRLRERWLEATQPGRWRLVDRKALGVTFEAQNLLHDAPLQPPSGGGWDAILCRNVLLYFTSEACATVVARLGRALESTGGLWPGPCDHIEVDPALGLAWQTRGRERFLAQGRATVPEPPSAPAPLPLRFAEPETTPARLVERGLLATARCAVEERLADHPDDGEMWLLLGAFHLREHAFDEALACLERAAADHPRQPGLAYLRGVAHLKAGQIDLATAAFGTALDDNPDDWASSCQLALLYRRQGRALREEVMLLRTRDRLGVHEPRAADLGVAAQLVTSVHSDPHLTRAEIERRVAALTGPTREKGRPS